MKINRFGQASVFTKQDEAKLRMVFSEHDRYWLMFEIARYTGARWGAIRQLRIENCYKADGTPREAIIFPKEIRKGKRDSRVVTTVPFLKSALRRYPIPAGELMFPGRDPDKPISAQAVDAFFRNALVKADIADKGYSTHSTRVTFITSLHNSGVSLSIIKKITGHRSLNCMTRYILPTDEQCKRALLTLQ